jgi:hypothetical protein
MTSGARSVPQVGVRVAVVVAAVAVLAVTALPATLGAQQQVSGPTTVAPVPTTVSVPPLQSPSFPAGIWKGTAVATGGISGHGAEGFLPEPIIVSFEFEVAPDGIVVNGIWGWNGEVVSAAEGVAGLFTMSGSGPLGGNAARIELSGNIHMSGTVTVNGAEYPIENDSPAVGAFSPRSVSCNVVSGDMATEGRQLQEGAGLATTVTAPFTAQRIGAPGDQGLANFEETYTELVLTAEGLLAAGVPPVEDVVALVERAESFYHQVYLSIECPAGGAASMLPGRQHYSPFVALLGQVLLTALADPSVFSADEVQMLAFAAVRIGVVGTAAPDPALSSQVWQALYDAVETKLADATAAQDKGDCAVLLITATAMGLAELVAPAQACLTS